MDIVEFLITSPNARINDLCGSYSHTISHVAASKGSVGILQVIGRHATSTPKAAKSRNPNVPSDTSQVPDAEVIQNIPRNQHSHRNANSSTRISTVNQLRWDIDKKDGVNLYSPLMTAIIHGHAHCVGYLIECGANVNFIDKSQRSCLYVAAENGHTNICENLLNNGALIDSTSKAGKSPLFVACDQGYIDVVTLLVGYGANVRLKSSRGKLPLYVAAEKGFKEIVKVLLDHSEVSDLFTMTSYGTTPFFIASKQLDKGVKSLFKRFCVKQQNLKKNGTKMQRFNYVYGKTKRDGPSLQRQMILTEHSDILQLSASDLISEESIQSNTSSQSSVQRALQDSQQWLKEREHHHRSSGPVLARQRSMIGIGHINGNEINGERMTGIQSTTANQELFTERLPTPLFAHEMEDFQDAQTSKTRRYNFSRYNGNTGTNHRYYRLASNKSNVSVTRKKRLWR